MEGRIWDIEDKIEEMNTSKNVKYKKSKYEAFRKFKTTWKDQICD